MTVLIITLLTRYVASQADVAVLEAFGSVPSDSTPHAKRWYSHIKSLSEADKKKLPGQKKAPSGFNLGTAPAGKPAPAPADDDDDVDLFGSDEDEVRTGKMN